MAKTGELDGQPLPCGALVADHSGAISLANGILGALYARERTGRGQKVDVSIYGTVLALQPMEINFTSVTGGIETDRAGRGHQFLKGVWGAFRTKDGFICLAGVDDARWPTFCRELGIEELVDDPECADVVTRNYRGFKVQDALDAAFPARTTAEWMERLARADILVAPVQDYRDILASEQARANGYITELDHPELGTVSVVGNPIGMSETPVGPAGPPPELGQNTEEVLLEAGFEWDEIETLRKSGAV
jgi:crotonobetainyl-CoA:carnitine CoA-transferase CaiB-like acyl-CoA transferase